VIRLPDTLGASIVAFCVAGAIGFIVDAASLFALVYGTTLTVWQARAVAFVPAVLVTWLFNRSITFRARTRPRLPSEMILYAMTQVMGAVFNYSVFCFVLAKHPLFIRVPIVPLILGSLAGLCLNFTISNVIVYSKARAMGSNEMNNNA